MVIIKNPQTNQPQILVEILEGVKATSENKICLESPGFYSYYALYREEKQQEELKVFNLVRKIKIALELQTYKPNKIMKVGCECNNHL